MSVSPAVVLGGDESPGGGAGLVTDHQAVVVTGDVRDVASRRHQSLEAASAAPGYNQRLNCSSVMATTSFTRPYNGALAL